MIFPAYGRLHWFRHLVAPAWEPGLPRPSTRRTRSIMPSPTESPSDRASSRRQPSRRQAGSPLHQHRRGSSRAQAAHYGAASSSRLAESAAGTSARRAALHSRRHHYYERFTASSFANGDIFADDVTAGEDPVVRQAAIDALGDMNGTAVVIDPSNGRILAMVNQKLALSPGAEPCSTIKLTVAMAALSEGLVTRDTPVKFDGFRMNMTQALAKSNNLYFEELGRELGFERVHHYANQFGLGELAGYNIRRRTARRLSRSGTARRRGRRRPHVQLRPGRLAHPAAARRLCGRPRQWRNPLLSPAPHHPRGGRQLFNPRSSAPWTSPSYVPDIEDGMAGAVEYGTARRLRANFHELPVFGKTGTCSDKGTRFGWFASFSDSPQGSLVTVFFLEGGRPTFGPRAAELTGEFYKNLWDRNWFAAKGLQDAASISAPPHFAASSAVNHQIRSAAIFSIRSISSSPEANPPQNHPIK